MTSAAQPPDNVGWVSGPNTRSTISLLWDCTCTILICTWSALHLNVPREGLTTWLLLRRKLRYLVVALVAPEWVSFQAVRDWHVARLTNSEMEHHVGRWDKTLSMFVDMGGVALRDKKDKKIRLPADMLNLCLKRRWIRLTDIDTHDVDDKSNGNYFTKTICFFQISWFTSQLLARVVSNLPVSPLELCTLAYVACAIFSYAFWWQKPFDVEVPLCINLPNHFTDNDKDTIFRETTYTKDFLQGRPSNLGPGRECGDTNFIIIVTFFAVVAFGACHLLGWNFSFPTNAEKVLWHVASIACLCIPSIMLAIQSLKGWLAKPEGDLHSALDYTFIGFFALYVVARISILFQVFFVLRSVPPTIYETVSWERYIPHL